LLCPLAQLKRFRKPVDRGQSFRWFREKACLLNCGQFRARYQGYKVPIEVFKNRTTLAAISKTPLYSKVKELIGEQLEEASEEGVEDNEASGADDSEKIAPTKGKKGPKKAKVSFFNAEKRRTAKEIREVERVMNERYVNLVDILPPLPQKGDFDIEVIKDSQYFFS
jgi:DNA-directed RNA polymerase